MESRVYGADSIVTWLHTQSFMPVGIQNWIALTILLAGLLGNVYLGLYIGEKHSKSLCGMRVMICNQVFANLLGLYSHAFLPTHNERLQDSGARLGYLCKIMPSLGFVGVTVSLSNLACICVAYYYNRKSSVVLSRRDAWLIVINLWFIAALLTTPLAISLDSVQITVSNTSAKMCAIVWQNRHYEESYMDYVFIFKFLLPLLVILTICLKIELLSVRRRKLFPKFPALPAILMNILAATCLMLLVYFYPLHNACAAKSSPFVKVLGSTTAFGIIRLLELIGLANCSIVPVVLKSCIDEYSKARDLCHDEQENDVLAVLGKDDAKCLLFLPSPNVVSVTYDALTENTVADRSMSNLKTKDFKILITL